MHKAFTLCAYLVIAIDSWQIASLQALEAILDSIYRGGPYFKIKQRSENFALKLNKDLKILPLLLDHTSHNVILFVSLYHMKYV